jgi:hypothetical protein
MKVRTTFMPDTELEVSDAEAVDLHRQGLLVVDTKKAQSAIEKVAEAVSQTSVAAPAAGDATTEKES